MIQNSNIAHERTSPATSRRGSNQSGMRAYNERLVLSLIRQNGALAKSEITRSTGLSVQTVSVIIRALLADGLLIRGEPVRGGIGQPYVPVSLAKDGAFFFGLNVGRRSLDLVLTDFLGTVVKRVRTSQPNPTPEKTIQFTSDAIGEILSGLSADQRRRVSGLGIALPFQLWDWDDAKSVAATQMHGWKDHDIASEIGAAWDFPVFICNDASSACGAELVFGDANKPGDFLYFFVGHFIGGGLALDSSVYTGITGNAAALGSLMIPKADGTMRQLVDIASLAALEKTLGDAGDEKCMFWEAPEDWTIPDAPLNAWLEDAAHGIAHAIMASICLIDVGHVLIDGWLPSAMRAELVQRVNEQIDRIVIPGVQKPKVIEGSIGSDARSLGAASLPLSNRFLVERNSYQKGPTK